MTISHGGFSLPGLLVSLAINLSVSTGALLLLSAHLRNRAWVWASPDKLRALFKCTGPRLFPGAHPKVGE